MNAAAIEDEYVPDVESALRLFANLARQPREQLGFAYLDPKWRLLGLRYTEPGSRYAALVPFRAVVSDVLKFDAAGLVMAHNHPRGDPTPSEADHAITRRLGRVLEAIDVRLLDHVILAGEKSASFRALSFL